MPSAVVTLACLAAGASLLGRGGAAFSLPTVVGVLCFLAAGVLIGAYLQEAAQKRAARRPG